MFVPRFQVMMMQLMWEEKNHKQIQRPHQIAAAAAKVSSNSQTFVHAALQHVLMVQIRVEHFDVSAILVLVANPVMVLVCKSRKPSNANNVVC